MIHQLPTEIIDHIACLLGQNDVLSLAYTHSTLLQAVLPRLYRSIHVDALPRNITDPAIMSYDTPHQPTHGAIPVTVRTLYALNQLLKKLQGNKHACREVEALVFHQKIPDVHESTFLLSLSEILSHCSRLSVFHWFCSNFNFPLHKLNIHNHWTQVCGNFDVSGIRKPISWYSLTTLNLSNIANPEKFENLDLSGCTNLQHLQLGQDAVLGSLPFDAIASTLISQLLTGTRALQPLTLQSLVLDNLQISVSDVKLLCESIDLLSLHHLTVVNCVEETPGILMTSLAQHLRDLRSLRCEWKRSIDYNYETMRFLAAFQKSCALVQAISLKFKIGSHQDCGQVLAQVLSQCSSRVRNLSVEIKGSYCSIPGASIMMSQLRRFEDLESLHLLLAQRQIPATMKIFRYLTRLKRVSIALSDSKGKHTAAAPVTGGSSLICDDMLNYHLSCGWDWFASRRSQFCNYSNDIFRIQPSVEWVHFNSERHYTFRQLNGKMSDTSI